jgi:hypothetical protein
MATEKQQIIDLKFVTFYNYFNKNFNYGFSNPKTDICDLCSQVIQEGVANLESTLKEEYEMHLEKVSSHKAYKNKILKNDSNVLQLEMDFCNTKPIPKLPNNSYYYSSAVNFNLFNITFHNINKKYMFHFMEGEFMRGPNPVCSFLYEALNTTIYLNIKKIFISSDLSGAQNRNYTVLKFLLWYSFNFNVKIIQVFTVRGHSYCASDRQFGLFSKEVKSLPKVESPEEYVQILNNFDFIVLKGKSYDYKLCFKRCFKSVKD